MAHVIALVEGRKLWLDLFLEDLEKRRYPCKSLDGQQRTYQPNVREVKLLDISVPNSCIPFLMSDLAPYAVNSSNSIYSPLKNKVATIARLVRIAGGLKPFKQPSDTFFVKVPFIGKYLNGFFKFFKTEPVLDYINSEEVRHNWVNVMPIGQKADNELKTSAFGCLPLGPNGGGELI